METKEEQPQTPNPAMRKAIILINFFLLFIGNCGGPLIMRLYFIHGGKRVWFSSWLQTGGWPIIFIPLFISYLRRSITAPPTTKTKLFYMKSPLLLYAAGVGLLTGAGCYLYSYGVARLPVSTSSLIIASQLVFTAVSAFLLVKQKFTSYAINSIFLLSVGAVVLALQSSSDRPAHESNREYILGFVTTFCSAALSGLTFPLIEMAYIKSKLEINYTLQMEVQMILCFMSTAFCTVGMIVNNDFKVIPREAREFELGETKYYLIIVATAVIWQCFFLGAIGIVFYASALSSGIMLSVLLPVTEVLSVIFYKEKFEAEKGVALSLSLWGLISYFYGQVRQSKKKKLTPTTEMSVSSNVTENV